MTLGFVDGRKQKGTYAERQREAKRLARAIQLRMATIAAWQRYHRNTRTAA